MGVFRTGVRESGRSSLRVRDASCVLAKGAVENAVPSLYRARGDTEMRNTYRVRASRARVRAHRHQSARARARIARYMHTRARGGLIADVRVLQKASSCLVTDIVEPIPHLIGLLRGAVLVLGKHSPFQNLAFTPKVHICACPSCSVGGRASGGRDKNLCVRVSFFSALAARDIGELSAYDGRLVGRESLVFRG